jgi:hypothetical protein
LANTNLKEMGVTYQQNYIKNKIISSTLDYILGILESFNKEYWLEAGTLLGRQIFAFSSNEYI